jgi:hypothetical protein
VELNGKPTTTLLHNALKNMTRKQANPLEKEIVKILLAAGATPVGGEIMFILKGGENKADYEAPIDVEVLELLMKHGAKPTLDCLWEATAHSAAFKAILSHLNPSKEELNARRENEFHPTLFVKTLQIGTADNLQLLLKRGVDLSIRYNNHHSHYHTVCEWSSNMLSEENKKKFLVLFNHGVSIHADDFVNYLKHSSLDSVLDEQIFEGFLKRGSVSSEKVVQVVADRIINWRTNEITNSILKKLMDLLPNRDLRSPFFERLFCTAVSNVTWNLVNALLEQGLKPREPLQSKIGYAFQGKKYFPPTVLDLANELSKQSYYNSRLDPIIAVLEKY